VSLLPTVGVGPKIFASCQTFRFLDIYLRKNENFRLIRDEQLITISTNIGIYLRRKTVCFDYYLGITVISIEQIANALCCLVVIQLLVLHFVFRYHTLRTSKAKCDKTPQDCIDLKRKVSLKNIINTRKREHHRIHRTGPASISCTARPPWH